MELATLWSTWLSVLEDLGFAARAIVREPASEAALAALEAAAGRSLPPGARALYGLADGQRTTHELAHAGVTFGGRAAAGIFGFYEFLSTEAAVREYAMWQGVASDLGAEELAAFADGVTVAQPDLVRGDYWNSGWIPFARDGGGNALGFDLAPAARGTVGQIIIFGSDEDHRRVIARDPARLLERLIDAAQADRLDLGGDGAERYYDAPTVFGYEQPESP
jgi:cell wall assembly regulator SMI1